MAKSFLDLVNAVLDELREDNISTFASTNAYENMIRRFVNKAKKRVEDAWKWTHLRGVDSLSVSAGTSTYSISGSGDRSYIVEKVLNTTTGQWLLQKPRSLMNYWASQDTSQATPCFWFPSGVAASDADIELTFYPVPNGSYTLSLYHWARQADLSATTDVLLVPSEPVIAYAYALAARERGEMGNMEINELFIDARTALADAVAKDAQAHGSETDWYVQ